MPRRLPRRAWMWLESPTGGAVMQLITAVVIVGFGIVFWFYSAQTHTALCTFRNDLSQRADNTERFLADHPGDLHFGSFTIPRSTLVAQLAAQKLTLRSLDNLNC